MQPTSSDSAFPPRRKVVGPIFNAVDQVLHQRQEYIQFRTGVLPRSAFGLFLDGMAEELVAHGVPAADVHFAKRYPHSEETFVDEALSDLVARGMIDTAQYDRALFAATQAEAARFDHDGYSTYIYPEEARLLFALTDIVKPRRALFLGSYYGYWASWALPPLLRGGGRAVLVDPDERVHRVARANLAAAGRSHAVELATTTGERFLEETRELFDFVVLDAEGPRDHPDPEQRGKRVYRPLLQHVLPRLAPGALLVCHNILLSDHSGASFFQGVIERNRDELGPFMALAGREFEGFTSYPSTEGVGVGRFGQRPLAKEPNNS
jgi:predicted O-methyltransferase YrrM